MATSVQLAEYVGQEMGTVGAKSTPQWTVKYTRLDGETPKTGMTAKFLQGSLDDASKTVLKNLKPGLQFVVVKHEVEDKRSGKSFWNLKEFRDASTWVEKPKKNNYENGGAGLIGIKVGAARNQALALMALLPAKSLPTDRTGLLDLQDDIAQEIVARQAAQEAAHVANSVTAPPQSNNSQTNSVPVESPQTETDVNDDDLEY